MPKQTSMNDKILAELFVNLQRTFDELIKTKGYKLDNGENLAQLYQELFESVTYALYADDGKLKNLQEYEHFKAYHIFQSFFNAKVDSLKNKSQNVSPDPFLLKQVEDLKKSLENQKNKTHYEKKRAEKYYNKYHREFYYYHSYDTSLWILYALSRPSFYYPSPIIGSGRGNIFVDVGRSSSNSSDEGAALVKLIALGLVACSLGFVAAWYVFAQTLDSIERISYNEGLLKGSVTFLTITLSTTIAILLASKFVAGPLAALAITAGFANPVGIVAFGIASISIIAAAITTYCVNKLIMAYIQKKNPDALDPTDAARFALTEEESNKLLNMKKDPIIIKCAIAAIRERMSPGLLPAMCTPNIFSLQSRRKEDQNYVEWIRDLRRGRLDKLTMGEFVFDFTLTSEMEKKYNELKEVKNFPQAKDGFFQPRTPTPYAPEVDAAVLQAPGSV